MAETGCCPDNAWPSLQTTYAPRGVVEKLGDLEVYTVGSGNSAVIVAYDIFGFKAGRCRAICDQLADAGYLAVLPDFYRGDGYPEDKTVEMDPVRTFVLQFPWKEKVEPDLKEKVLPFVKQKGVTKVAVMGFCWGAWFAFHASASDEIACGVSFHPSLGVEQMFGGTVKALTENVKAPQILLPAGDDPVQPGGEVITILESRPFGAKCKVHAFPDMRHGFVSRGDLSQPEVMRDVRKAMELALDFLKENL